MPAKLGLDCVLHRNTGNYASPTWNAIPNVKDLTLSLEKAEADVTTRASGGWRWTIGTLKDATLEFQMVADSTDDDFTAIQTAFFANTAIEFAALDGSSATNGSQGLRATMDILKFSRNEELENAVMFDVTLKPTYAANAPAWMTVP